jgi:glycosyltransferase involved in cell wall biosynthesis
LPQDLRRKALYGAIDLVAPRAEPASRLRAGPVRVGGVLSTANGLGESARLCLDALRALGWDAGHLDVSTLFLRPDLPGVFAGNPAIAGEAGTLILHINGPYMPYVAWRLGRAFLSGRRIIGYWAWELPLMGPDWQRGLRQAHEIWVPSRFTADALPADAAVPVKIVPHPVQVTPVARNRDLFAIPSDIFTVLTAFDMGSSYSRKNPRAAITAFRKAFGDDQNSLLLLKVGHSGDAAWAMKDLEDAIAGMSNVRLIEQTLSKVEMATLVASADAVLSLHRAEGFGLLLAEAMLQGVPAVATGWSGNVDFMTPDDSCLVAYNLIPAIDPQGTYNMPHVKWAEADTDEAAHWLKRLRNENEFRLTLGKRGKEAATAKLSLTAYKRTIESSLAAPSPADAN